MKEIALILNTHKLVWILITIGMLDTYVDVPYGSVFIVGGIIYGFHRFKSNSALFSPVSQEKINIEAYKIRKGVFLCCMIFLLINISLVIILYISNIKFNIAAEYIFYNIFPFYNTMKELLYFTKEEMIYNIMTSYFCLSITFIIYISMSIIHSFKTTYKTIYLLRYFEKDKYRILIDYISFFILISLVLFDRVVDIYLNGAAMNFLIYKSDMFIYFYSQIHAAFFLAVGAVFLGRIAVILFALVRRHQT